MIDGATIDFVLAHEKDDTSSLLFAAASYRDIDMKTAVRLIEARRKAASKLPSWYACSSIDYPSSLSLEQCSSEATALYKQRFVREGDVVADITGGLGVDSWALSGKASRLCYFERQELLCEAARSNFAALGVSNVEIACRDSIDSSRSYDLVFADPARRSKTSRRVYALEDCEPDILQLKPLLLSLAPRLLVKISPMADISQMLRLFPDCSEVHVVSSAGEVKELLLYIVRDFEKSGTAPRIFAGDFSFAPEDEHNAKPRYASSIGRYIYSPNKAVLKSGAFKLLCERYGVEKLDVSTHLYTSDRQIPDFPGKRWTVVGVEKWNKETASSLRQRYSSLELTALNFPLDTAALRRRLKIADGGDEHLFATTVASQKMIIIARQ
ncbi:MAG: SAM-dependent methyltransferase [Bacteroidales bacterium]|nr:SAM-dependent methyltransferase [Candidatus Cacconaster merdequi]